MLKAVHVGNLKAVYIGNNGLQKLGFVNGKIYEYKIYEYGQHRVYTSNGKMSKFYPFNTETFKKNFRSVSEYRNKKIKEILR